MSARPLVSVCIPARDGARFLPECLESVLAQTFGGFEVVLVDDASNDSTLAVARAFARRDRRVRLSRNRRPLGLVGNWERSVALARGDWIKFVFQDDLLRPRCLERMLAARSPGVPLVACRRDFRFEAGVSAAMRRMFLRHRREHSIERRFPGRRYVPPEAFARLMLRAPDYNCVGEPTATLIHRSAFERFGGFHQGLVNLCDWEFVARVAVNAGLAYAPETLAVFRVHTRARSWENRLERRFQAEVMDELIVRHDLAYAPAYAPVRRQARLTRPAVDLRGLLAACALRSRALVGTYAADRLSPDRGAAQALRRTLERYPRALAARPREPRGRRDGSSARERAALGLAWSELRAFAGCASPAAAR